jgi:hypothetical protein
VTGATQQKKSYSEVQYTEHKRRQHCNEVPSKNNRQLCSPVANTLPASSGFHLLENFNEQRK